MSLRVARSQAPPGVAVEVLALAVGEPGAGDGRHLRWHARRAAVTGSPDETARALAAGEAAASRHTVLHSTSWRYEAGAQLVVLTYALFPAVPRARGRSVPLGEHIVTGPGPLHPTPPEVRLDHVAAHAVRHLAYLAAGRDPHVTGSARAAPAVWEVLLRHGAAVHAHPDAARAHEPTPA